MPKRINPIAQYLIYLAGTLAAYGVYAFAVVPKIESNQLLAERSFTPRTATSPTDRKQKFSHLFPAGAWELGPCKVLETSQGTVLFKDYQPYDDGHVEVLPFTMIIRGDKLNEEGNEIPIVLRSSNKAVLKFERPFELNGGDPGKIQNGELAGNVSIYRPPSEPGADDFLKILTSNVQLEKHKIYTIDDVEFEFGNSHGKGRNLGIELSLDTPLDAINTDFSKINGVKSLQLGYLQKLRIQPPAKKENSNRMLAGQRAPLEIRCKGAFGFDFENQKANFFDQVVVKQLDDSGQSLQCEQLTLIFDSKVKDSDSPMVNTNSNNLADQDLRLRKVIAVGSPLNLVAKNKDATVRAEFLEYDITLNTIVARSEDSVLFQMGNQQFTGNDIQYRIREDGAIGPLLAQGPGSMRRIDQDRSFEAKWSESLTIRPNADRQKLVTLKGQSELTLDQQTTVAGEDMMIYLWEVPKAKSAQDGLPMIGNSEEKSSWEYLPHELRSSGQVKIRSEKLNGSTTSLIARWPAPDFNAQANLESLRRANSDATVNQNTRSFQTQTHLAPISPRPNMPQNGLSNSQVQLVGFRQTIEPEIKKLPTKLNFVGKVVEVDFSSAGRDAEISRLVIEGQVRIHEVEPSDPNSIPLEIEGEQVFLVPQSKELYRLNVAGNARIAGKGLNLVGPDIHLDQTANRLWVVGGGTMKIQKPAKESEAATHTPADDIAISWRGGMIFDGRKIYFEDEVSAVGMQTQDEKRSQVRSLSEALSIMLEKEIDFKNLKGGKENDGVGDVEIREMILVDRLTDDKRVFDDPDDSNQTNSSPSPVVFEKLDFDPSGQVIAKQKMIVPHASVDMISGNVRASGPGTLMNWQNGKMESADGLFRQAATQIGGTEEQAAKSFIRINFDKILVSDGQNDHVQINGKVRMLYAPVDNFEQQFNPDNATRPAGAIKLTCEQMEMAQWKQRGAEGKTNELSASGNARIFGDQFDATADRLNYSEVKDLLTLESSTRATANLSYVDPNTRRQQKLAAGKILYRPSDGWTEIQQVQEASSQQRGSIFRDR